MSNLNLLAFGAYPYIALAICVIGSWARFDLSQYTRIHAYGDSSEDKPMLALAHERWYRGKPVS